MKRQLPSQTLEEQFFSPSTRKAPLSESIRMGAQLMLQKAVELEVTEFLGRDHYQRSRDGVLQGYRNGYEDKQVQTAEGPLHLKMPQERDTVEAFDSVWLRTLVRRSDKLDALIPQLYVKGMSTRDIEAALSETLEVEGVSKSTVSTLCGSSDTISSGGRTGICQTKTSSTSSATASISDSAPKTPKPWLFCVPMASRPMAGKCCSTWR